MTAKAGSWIAAVLVVTAALSGCATQPRDATEPPESPDGSKAPDLDQSVGNQDEDGKNEESPNLTAQLLLIKHGFHALQDAFEAAQADNPEDGERTQVLQNAIANAQETKSDMDARQPHPDLESHFTSLRDGFGTLFEYIEERETCQAQTDRGACVSYSYKKVEIGNLISNTRSFLRDADEQYTYPISPSQWETLWEIRILSIEFEAALDQFGERWKGAPFRDDPEAANGSISDQLSSLHQQFNRTKRDITTASLDGTLTDVKRGRTAWATEIDTWLKEARQCYQKGTDPWREANWEADCPGSPPDVSLHRVIDLYGPPDLPGDQTAYLQSLYGTWQEMNRRYQKAIRVMSGWLDGRENTTATQAWLDRADREIAELRNSMEPAPTDLLRTPRDAVLNHSGAAEAWIQIAQNCVQTEDRQCEAHWDGRRRVGNVTHHWTGPIFWPFQDEV